MKWQLSHSFSLILWFLAGHVSSNSQLCTATANSRLWQVRSCVQQQALSRNSQQPVVPQPLSYCTLGVFVEVDQLVASSEEQPAKLGLGSSGAPVPRKPLVKGERFMRYVTRAWPALLFTTTHRLFISLSRSKPSCMTNIFSFSVRADF